jgi:hypothetical protein
VGAGSFKGLCTAIAPLPSLLPQKWFENTCGTAQNESHMADV